MKYIATNDKEQKIIDFFLESYNETNYISKFLYKNFFKSIENIIFQCKHIDKTLEVGCGLGESSLRLNEMLIDSHFEVSEYDKNYVSILKNSDFKLKITNETVYDLQHSDNSFDLVIMLEVLEHLEDYQKAIGELCRVSSKYVLISVPNEPLWRTLNFLRGKYIGNFGNTPGHINHFNVKSLKKILRRYGTVKSISKPLPWIVICIEVNDENIK